MPQGPNQYKKQKGSVSRAAFEGRGTEGRFQGQVPGGWKAASVAVLAVVRRFEGNRARAWAVGAELTAIPQDGNTSVKCRPKR